MDKKDLKIVFMGTPDFAVESLRALVENKYNVVGVITMPDKPSGRGHKIQYSAVKEYALEKSLPLLQPEKLKDETFLQELKAWDADLQIVVAFRMLPEVVWDMPRFGTFNLHASLLPQYRGAAPINWAIINGEKETGVTTFFLTHEIDTGKIIRQKKVEIKDSDNVGIVHDKLMMIGAQLVVETVDLLLANQIKAIPQEQLFKNKEELKSAPKIFKETCKINWNSGSTDIYNFIRGLSPYPVAWTELHRKDSDNIAVKIYKGTITNQTDTCTNRIGSIVTDNKSYLGIICKDGILNIEEIQLPGKKRMSIQELLRGYKFEEESYFE